MTLRSLAAITLLSGPLHSLQAANLSLGADYLLRSVATEERLNYVKDQKYYDSRLQAYLTTDLSKDVEASIRVQSISPWGLEGSSNPLTTRYPNANGNVWVQNAYLRLPNIWKNRIILTLGRQPLQWGDGAILADDELGFNALRAQIKSPLRFLPIDVDVFTAKVTEGLRDRGDTDLHGVNIGFNREVFRWEIMGLWENSNSTQTYQSGGSLTPVNVGKQSRQIYGVRAKTNLKDAYLKGEFYQQSGKIKPLVAGDSDIKLDGQGYIVGLGGKATNRVVGRFGAVVEYALGEGDDPKSTDKDEAFRPTFQSRWSGLERKGYGKYFAGTFSDAYSPTNPFGPASSANTGLPEGLSGIQTIKFGIDSTPWAEWTFSIDFYQFKAQNVIRGSKDLGSEIDYGIEYRYSGLVTFKAYLASFKPGEAFSASTVLNPVETKQSANLTTIEAEIKF